MQQSRNNNYYIPQTLFPTVYHTKMIEQFCQERVIRTLIIHLSVGNQNLITIAYYITIAVYGISCRDIYGEKVFPSLSERILFCSKMSYVI